jgi:hypothetical protein
LAFDHRGFIGRCWPRTGWSAPECRGRHGQLCPLRLEIAEVLHRSWEAASLHGGRITPEVADYAYAFGNVGFANVWIALASFALCSGWVILTTRVLERWMGWWVVVAGLGLVVARFVWTTGFWGVGYMLFWLWVLVVSIRLILRPDRWSSAAR